MKINRGFRITPRELRFRYGYTCDRLRCVRVRVRYGKIPPAVYPCSTLALLHRCPCQIGTSQSVWTDSDSAKISSDSIGLHGILHQNGAEYMGESKDLRHGTLIF